MVCRILTFLRLSSRVLEREADRAVWTHTVSPMIDDLPRRGTVGICMCECVHVYVCVWVSVCVWVVGDIHQSPLNFKRTITQRNLCKNTNS